MSFQKRDTAIFVKIIVVLFKAFEKRKTYQN